ncbi:aminotransferase class V-fold PLP-dependent enzyme [Pseudomonas sp. RIT-PI-AD]|uniref:aminotransferase class V-fold PLP-dependent enzyme n=1 Tax=Pseudomonas sp. RIT-PI-AD TaxID=3035294 RepID=UPI0021DB1285|nr:aminotransferase class V-fold PLP-dependent enzyme [Pseudomonas sp. RIT-PI-AD]
MHPIAAIACQRASFDLPRDVSYLDAAAWAPLPIQVRRAGETGLLTKSQPWAYSRDVVPVWAERARSAAAGLIGAQVDDMAILGSVSQGMATAALNLAPAAGGRVLRMANEFPSLCLAFDRLAGARGLLVEEVPRPANGDWTAALLAAITRPAAAPLAVATLTPLHWTDGASVDLERLAPAIRATGAAFVVDATQAVGAQAVDVARLQPDFLAFPTYKWTLGPYGMALLYVAPHRQEGLALEANSGNGPSAIGARRYDRGELYDPVALPMAATALELVAEWGVPAIAARLGALTDALAEGLQALGFQVAPRASRSAQMIGGRLPGGLPHDLIDRLRAEKVFASLRGDALRLSPHVWVDEADCGRVLDVLERLLRDD